jgi:hypothetical protein
VAALGAGLGAHDLLPPSPPRQQQPPQLPLLHPAGGHPALLLYYAVVSIGALWSACTWSVALETGDRSVTRRRVWKLLGLQCVLGCLLLFIGFDLAEIDELNAATADAAAAAGLTADSAGASGSGSEAGWAEATAAAAAAAAASGDGQRTEYLQGFLFFLLLGVLINGLKIICVVSMYCCHVKRRRRRRQQQLPPQEGDDSTACEEGSGGALDVSLGAIAMAAP